MKDTRAEPFFGTPWSGQAVKWYWVTGKWGADLAVFCENRKDVPETMVY